MKYILILSLIGLILISVNVNAKIFPCDLTEEEEKQIEERIFELVKDWDVGAELIKVNGCIGRLDYTPDIIEASIIYRVSPEFSKYNIAYYILIRVDVINGSEFFPRAYHEKPLDTDSISTLLEEDHIKDYEERLQGSPKAIELIETLSPTIALEDGFYIDFYTPDLWYWNNGFKFTKTIIPNSFDWEEHPEIEAARQLIKEKAPNCIVDDNVIIQIGGNIGSGGEIPITMAVKCDGIIKDVEMIIKLTEELKLNSIASTIEIKENESEVIEVRKKLFTESSYYEDFGLTPEEIFNLEGISISSIQDTDLPPQDTEVQQYDYAPIIFVLIIIILLFIFFGKKLKKI